MTFNSWIIQQRRDMMNPISDSTIMKGQGIDILTDAFYMMYNVDINAVEHLKR